MADILTSQIQVPSLPNDTLILKDAEARQDLSTALATVTGNPLNFTTRSAQKANETVISLSPIQDLHGYDNPWPAGGGKNKLPMTVDGIKALNPDITTRVWDGNVYKIGANQEMTVTILTDGDNNVIGIKINGIYTSNIVFKLASFTFLANVSYSMNGCPSGGGNRYVIGTNSQVYQSEGPFIDAGSGVTFSYSQDSPLSPNITIYANNQVDNVVFQPMLRLATETDATFAPYTNICPISGRTSVSLDGCGKNFVEGKIESSHYLSITSNGTISVSSQDAVDMYYAKVVKGQTYTATTGNILVCGFFYDKPIEGSVSYNNGRIVSNDTTFVAPISGYVAFRVDATYDTPQLEFGSRATAYEPYTQSNDLTISFGQTVYGATFTMETGALVVGRAIVDMGDMEWTYGASGAGRFVSNISESKNYGQSAVANALCSAFKFISAQDVYAGYEGIASYSKAIWVHTNSYGTDPTVFKTAMTGQTICYELATPTTIQLTPNEISLLSGVNNISTDGNSITLTYRDGKVATLGDLEGLKDIVINDTYSPSYRGKNVVHMGDSWVELYNIAELAADLVGYYVTNVGFQATAITDVYDGTPVTDADKFSLIRLAHALDTNVWTEQDTAAVGKSWADQLAKLKAIDWSLVDVLILSYGVNDFNYQSAIGDAEARDEESVGGALKTAIGILENLNPYMEIVVTTPCFRFMSPDSDNMTNFGTRILIEEYRNVIGLTAKECSIKVVDMGAISGINDANRNLTLLNDGLHPTVLGQQMWSNAFAKSLECGYTGAFDINVFNVLKDGDNLCFDNEQYTKHKKWNSSYTNNLTKYLCTRSTQQYKNMVLGQAFFASLPTGSVLRMTGIGKKIGTQNHRVDIYVYNSNKSEKLLEKTSSAIKYTDDTAFDHSWTTTEAYTNCWVIFAVKQMSTWADGKALVRDAKCTVTLPS